MMGLIVLVLMFSVSIAAAAASEESINMAKSGGYTVTPAQSTGDVSILWVYDTITQGETNWHSKEVKDFITTLNVDLNWGNPDNSLKLTIHSPDGYVFGPYFDNADGVIDGRINLQS